MNESLLRQTRRQPHPNHCYLQYLDDKYFLAILSLFIALQFGTCGCQQRVQNAETNPLQIDTPNAATDYFPDKIKATYAKNFSVTYHNNYKVVRTSATLGDWGAQTAELEDIQDVMILVQRGTPPPKLTGELEGATQIIIPATERIATNSSALEIWMEMLELRNNQVAIGGTKTYDDSLREQAISGEIGIVGYSWAAPPDMEVLLDRKPNIFLMVLFPE